MYIYVMHYLNFVCHTKSNLTLGSASCLFTIKCDVIFPFYKC